MVAAIASIGRSSSTAAAARAAAGAWSTRQLCESCEMVSAPLAWSAFSPATPSAPMPVRIAPTEWGPAVLAAVANSRLADGRAPLTGSERSSRSPQHEHVLFPLSFAASAR